MIAQDQDQPFSDIATFQKYCWPLQYLAVNNTRKNAGPPPEKNASHPTCIAAPLDGWTPSMTNEQGSIKQGRILVKGNVKEIFTDVDFF